MAVKFNNNRTLYEDLAKGNHSIDEQEFLTTEYPDFFSNGGNKKVKSKNLGEKFAHINAFFFDYLKEFHIPTAFVKSQTKNSLKFYKHERFPFEIKILNVIDKRTAKIFSKKENETLTVPIFEYHYGEGKDSLVSESHLVAFNICSNDELKLMLRICSKVNAVLKSFFERRSSVLAEVSCCFGKHEEKIYLVDDFTPRSIKVLPLEKEGKWADPYKMSTAPEIKKYTDHLHTFTSA